MSQLFSTIERRAERLTSDSVVALAVPVLAEAVETIKVAVVVLFQIEVLLAQLRVLFGRGGRVSGNPMSRELTCDGTNSKIGELDVDSIGVVELLFG